jgi:hypothetical protein
MARYKVEFVELSGGRCIPVHLLVCPECKTFDTRTDIDTGSEPWKATCPRGHEFDVDPRPNA